jgi:hypothetical protein
MLDLFGRVAGFTIISYLMFWVSWLWLHIDALVFLWFSKDKKFKPSPPPGSSIAAVAGL